MACQMGLRRLFADKRRCAVSDRMTLGAALVTVFTLLVFYLMLRRQETSATLSGSECELEAQTAMLVVVNAYCAAVQQNGVLHDGESETGASHLS